MGIILTRERIDMPATINAADCATCLTDIAVGYVCAYCAESIPDTPGEFPGDYTQAVRMGVVELAREFRDFYHGEVRGTVEDFFQGLYHDMHGAVPYELEWYIKWDDYAEDMLDGGDYILIETPQGDHMLRVF